MIIALHAMNRGVVHFVPLLVDMHELIVCVVRNSKFHLEVPVPDIGLEIAQVIAAPIQTELVEDSAQTILNLVSHVFESEVVIDFDWTLMTFNRVSQLQLHRTYK